MKTYYWPLVLIGATLMIIGPALPWFRWSGGFPMPWKPTSVYVTGFERTGVLPATGGVILLLIAVLEHGKPRSRGIALFLSLLCGLFMAGMGCLQLQPTFAEPEIWVPAFGLWVSLLGVVFSIVGSLMRLQDSGMRMKPDIIMLMVLELSVAAAGVALATHPIAGNWLGFWHTDLPKQPCFLTLTGDQASCYATATAKAIQLTPPAWWPSGH